MNIPHPAEGSPAPAAPWRFTPADIKAFIGGPLDSPNISWAWLETVEPIDVQAPTVQLHIHVCFTGQRLILTKPTLTADFGAAWDGYHCAMFGYLYPEIPPHATLRDPYWSIPAPDSGWIGLELWHRRAAYRDAPLYAEIQWDPDGGTRLRHIVIPGDDLPSPTDMNATRYALGLLQQVTLEKDQQRVSRFFDSPDALRQLVTSTYQAQWRAMGRRPTQEETAKAILPEGRGGDASSDPARTLRRWLRDHLHERWREFTRSIESPA